MQGSDETFAQVAATRPMRVAGVLVHLKRSGHLMGLPAAMPADFQHFLAYPSPHSSHGSGMLEGEKRRIRSGWEGYSTAHVNVTDVFV